MSLRRAAAPVSLVALLSGCIYDGAYVIRGRIRGRVPSGVGIVENASAVVTADRKPNRTSAWVGRDGTFEARYLFGGMWFFPFFPGDGDPHVEFSAPGYRNLLVRVRGHEAQDGVTRRACVPPARGTYCMDVVLAPEMSSPDDGAR
jgi:hypothetical protein